MRPLYNNTANKALLIIIMILTGTFGLIATDIYAPSLPLVPALFNTSITLAQLTVSVFLAGLAIAQLISGMLSDSYGRKPVLITGLLAFLLGTLFCIYATSITFLLVGRIIEGIGAGAVAVLSRILLKDTFSGIKMAQVGSWLAAGIVLSPAIAPVIGGFLQQDFGFSAIFIFLLLFASTLFYLSLFHLPETNRFRHLHPLSIKPIFEKYMQVLRNRIFWANVIVTSCALTVIIVCAVLNPFILQNGLKITLAHYGILACIAMSGLFFGMIINGFLVARLGIKKMIISGILLILASGTSLIMFALFSTLSTPTIIIPTFIITLAAAFILPNAFVGAFTPFPEMAGTVGSVYGFLQVSITAMVSSLISAINVPSQLLLGVIVASLMVISISTYSFLEKERSLIEKKSFLAKEINCQHN